MGVSLEELDSQLKAAAQPKTSVEDLDEKLITGYRAAEEAAIDLLQANFDPGNFAPATLRWSLARGDNFEEKQLRLKKKYPEGELDVLPKSVMLGFEQDTLVYRESPQAQWKFTEPQGFDRFDIPEALAGSAESILAETLAAFNTKGMSFFTLVGRQMAAAMAGESVEQLEQSLGNVQAQTATGVVGEVALEGGYSAGGNIFIGGTLSAFRNMARGSGILKVGEEGEETIRAAADLDSDIAKKLTPGLVSDNPAARVAEKQAVALLPGLQRRYNYLIKKLDIAVKSSAPGNAASAMKDTLAGLKDFGHYFLNQIRVVGTRMSAGGRDFADGVAQYSKDSFDVVSGLYDKARSMEEPIFDMEPALMLARDLEIGLKGPIDGRVAAQIAELRAIKGPKELSPDPVTGEQRFLSVTDQLRNVRTELWSLKHVDDGKVFSQANGQANDLYKAINGMMSDPKNTNTFFREAYKTANEAASERFAKLEAAPIVAAAKSEAPEDLVKTYLRPGNATNLLVIRDTIPASKWRGFVDAAYSELLRNPEKILDENGLIGGFDQETLDVIMPLADQVTWKKVGREAKRIFNIGADEMAELQVKNSNFIDSLIRSSTPQDARTLIRAMNNTNNRGWRDSVRASIVDWAWDGVVLHEKAGLAVNRPLLKTRIELLKRNNMWSILSSEERRIISNANIVSRAFSTVQNAGTQLIGATAVSGAGKLQATALFTFLRYGMISHFYLSDMGRKVLIGSGIPNTNSAGLKVLGASLARMSVPEDISKPPDGDN